jgi:DNA-binding XRE family transcriptional regulator
MRQPTVRPGAGTEVPAPSARQIVCENLRLAFIWHGMGRKDAAQLLGIGYHAACSLWNNRHNVTAEEAWKVATAFHIPVERFYSAHTPAFEWIYEREN